MDILGKALELAETAHEGQLDKLGRPYINHPKAVASILRNSPFFNTLTSEDKFNAVAAAYLHDVIEDTSIDAKHLLDYGFSKEVVGVVKLLTYNKEITREAYYLNILTSQIARAVKVADLVHNNLKSRMNSLPLETQNKLKAKYAVSVKYIVPEEQLEWFNKSIDS